MTFQPFTATILGSPRIGPRRELKRAIEGYWAGRIDRTQLGAVGAGLRRDTWAALADGGLDSVPVNTFSYYDQMLDTAVLLGALPPRVDAVPDPLDRYFAAARGTGLIAPLEMTKWFDTNYHYIVPEIGPRTQFSLNPDKVLDELKEAHSQGISARPVIIGPITFLALSKAVDGAGEPIQRLEELLPLYVQLLRDLAAAGAQWVQIDEPVLVTDIVANAAELAERTYATLSQAAERPAIFVATYFGALDAALPALARTGVEAIGVDLVAGGDQAVAAIPELADKLLVAGVVDGRNIWRTDLEAALARLAVLLGSAKTVAVSTSCSTLHVPYSLDPETELDAALRSWLSFGAEKVSEVAILAKALRDGRPSVEAEIATSNHAKASRENDPRLRNEEIRARVESTLATGNTRGAAELRRQSQDARLHLPALPTTTIGSYPQTTAIRNARAALRAGDIDQAEYTHDMRAEVAAVIALQEDLGLDVLVHGEPERNDMVQYFAEQLEGFFATQNGWVQSYGTRCVRPPILYGDVSRPHPMTVDWATYAQSLTNKPVKGMLTGPVTILAWAVGAFRLSTSGVSDATQIHTHLCYSEFGEVIGAIADLDADVTSIEAARSHMEVLDDLNAVGFSNSVGPGVYDIHSPRVPSTEEIAASLRAALKAVPAQRLWVNPDCGLKTRGAEEVTKSLRNLVAAATQVRAES